MIVKTPGSQMGSPAAAEAGGEEMGGEKCESGERSEVERRYRGLSKAHLCFFFRCDFNIFFNLRVFIFLRSNLGILISS